MGRALLALKAGYFFLAFMSTIILELSGNAETPPNFVSVSKIIKKRQRSNLINFLAIRAIS